MLYSGSITIPAGTEKTTPTITTIKCSAGILCASRFDFPLGCNHYVKVAVYMGGHQIIPATQDMTLIANGAAIEGKEYILLNSTSNLITVKGWSTDTIYDHTIYYQVWVLPEDILAFGTLMSRVPDLVRKILTGRKKKEGE